MFHRHVTNAASADARQENNNSSQTPSTDQHEIPRKSDSNAAATEKPQLAPRKRPRFDKKTYGKRRNVTYDKQKPATSLSIVPRIRYFPIFTSNIGCRMVAELTYQAIRSKDYRLAQNITELQLVYVLTIAFCNRLAQCGIQFGYAFVEDASRLKQIATGIQLPHVLAQFIESIGMFSLSSTATVVPFVDNYERLFPRETHLMVDPAVILTEAGRPVPPRPWALDVDWIIAYNEATTRASRSGMNFRTVNNVDLQGRNEMVVSYECVQDNMLLPKAPQVMTEAEVQLGAVYRFRDYAQRRLWFGMHHELLFDAFIAIPCDPTVVFSDVCVAAFKGSVISTD